MKENEPITIKIKKEFKNLICPLLRHEYLQLEANIIADGCRDPIITWNDYIIDGHNRYEICTKNNIPFKVLEMEFECHEAVIAWICANQLGRRNITEEIRKFLIGMQYETEKIVNSRKNEKGKNQYSTDADEDYPEDCVEEITCGLRTRHRTAQRIASENHISHGTVQKYAIYTRALEAIGSKEPELVPKVLSGRYKISHNAIVDMAKLSAEELKMINKRLNRSHSPVFQYSKSRNVVQANSTVAPQPVISLTSSIKDMPVFDPDAEVTELSLTIPSWISSIRRTKNQANLSIISEPARLKLIEALTSLEGVVTEILISVKEEE